MKCSFRRSLVVTMGCALLPIMTAAASAIPAVLSLNDAVRLALRASPLLRAAFLDARAADAETAGVQRQPDLDITLNPSVAGGSKDAVTITQALGGGGQRSARVAAAEAQAAHARAAITQQMQTLRYEVAVTYSDLQAAQARVEVQRRGHVVARRFLDTAQAQFRAGNVSRAQVVRAEIELAGAKLALGQAEAEKRIAQMVLRRMLDPSERAEGPVATILGHGPEPQALAPSITSATERRPEVIQAEATLAAAHAERELLAAQGWPLLAVSGWLDDQWEPASNLGLSVTVQILPWSFVTLAQQRKAAEARVAAATQRAAAARNQVVTDVRAAHGRWTAAHRSALLVGREVVPRAEKLLAMSDEAFLRGANTYLELLDARRTLLNGRMTFIQALQAENTAAAAFIRAVAEPIDIPLEGTP